MSPRTTRLVLECPTAGRHTLAQVRAKPGAAFEDPDPYRIDNGSCHVVPEPDAYLLIEIARRRTPDPAARVALSALASMLRVPNRTARDLIGAGLPIDLATRTVSLEALAQWTHTARSGPGRDNHHWSWTCWPCLREGRPYHTSTGAAPVRTLVRLASAVHLAGASPTRAQVTARALRNALAATAAGVSSDDLERAATYFTVRLDLTDEPSTARLITKLHRPGVSEH